MSTTQSGLILLTGGTGLLGRSILRTLLSRSDAPRVLALVRRTSNTAIIDHTCCKIICGDITSPDLGLAPAHAAMLRRRVTAIVHCAADIRFGLSLDCSRRVNRDGTKHLLNFAESCPRLERFGHISTVYVAGASPGLLPEEPIPAPLKFFNAYTQSKWEAEQLVLSRQNTVPVSIYRVSTVLSDSADGAMSQRNYLHRLLKLAAANPLDAIPGQPLACLDLVTADWVAAIFDQLFADHFKPGEVFHICAGQDRSLPVAEFLARTFEFIEKHGLSHRKPARRPEIISPGTFDAARARFLSTPSRRQFWASLSLFLPHLSLMQSFDNTKSSTLLGKDIPLFPDIRATFDNVLRTCLLPE